MKRITKAIAVRKLAADEKIPLYIYFLPGGVAGFVSTKLTRNVSKVADAPDPILQG
jgi:hypothetical protein